MNGLKKLLANKNTVTVIGIVAVIAVLYFAYNWRVNQATNPVIVPYAIKTISPGVQIKDDMVGSMKVSPSMVTKNVLTKKGDVIDKYSNSDTVIPAGSLFFTRTVVEKEQLPAGDILDIEKGYVLYNMAVDIRTTYGNSVYPGNYIDIYIKILKSSRNNDGAMYIGKLIENIKVLNVKDSAGKPVFKNRDQEGVPAMLIFALPESYFKLLKKVELLDRSYQSQIIIVPTNNSQEETPGDINISSKELQAFINRITKSEEIIDEK